MRYVQIGGNGALKLDGKFHIHALRYNGLTDWHGLSDTFFAIADDKGKVRRLDLDFQSKFKQAFLGASYKLISDDFSAKINVRAVTPFYFCSNKNVPAALFAFKVKNTTQKTRRFMLGALIENLHQDAFHEKIETNSGVGVQLSSVSKLTIHADYSTQAVLFSGNADVVRYVDSAAPDESFLRMLRDFKLDDSACALPTSHRHAVVVSTLVLEPGQSEEIYCAYAWYAPNLHRDFDRDGVLYLNGCLDYKSAVDAASSTLHYADRFIGLSKAISDKVRSDFDENAYAQAVFRNFYDVFSAVPMCFSEFGKAKLFYKNKYATNDFYEIRDGMQNLSAAFRFDALAEAVALQWLLEYAVDASGLVERTDESHEVVLDQLSPIFRVYRLFKVTRDVSLFEKYREKLFDILDYVKNASWVKEGECLVYSDSGNARKADVADTYIYILAMFCMREIALALQDHDTSERLDAVLQDSIAFMKRNFFDGRRFIAQYPSGDEGVCSLRLCLPIVLAHLLGFEVFESGQVEIALENIYMLNYINAGANSGVKLLSGRDEIDSEYETLYIYALLKAGKHYLASLVCKAQNKRNIASGSAVCLIVDALYSGGYQAKDGTLEFGKNGLLSFLDESSLIVDGKDEFKVHLFGKSIHLAKVSVQGKEVCEITCNGKSLPYVNKEGIAYLDEVVELTSDTAIVIKTK